MEENKKDFKTEQNTNTAAVNGANANGGGRRRRHHRHGNHGANGGGKNMQNVNAQNAQNAPKGELKGNAPQEQTAQKQNQNAQKQAENNGNNGKKKNKNKDRNNKPQQAQQNQQNQQNAKGQKPQKQNADKAANKEKDRNERVEKVEKNEKIDKNERKKEENRKDTYAYVLDGNLYINLTNKCSNACDFCVRNERDSYYGNYLWLRHGDPTVEKVIAAVSGMGDLTRFKEAVFCGFGEPTYKIAEIVELCDYFHEKGLKTRLNTNGQGNLINKRDITPDLKDKIDLVNVSLNASCVEKYQPICRSQFGEAGFAGLIEFAKLCRRNGVACRFSIVDCIGEEEVEACKRLAQSVNIPLYVRDYITDS